MDKRYLTVSALNRYIKTKIDNDIQLQNILIKGEISNLKRHSSQHIYFTLKDDQARISAVMFASHARKLNFDVKDGDKVLIEASVSVYMVTGTYQLYVNKMEPDGIGNLFLKYEQLKKKLSDEGLFDQKYKKEIPKYPGKIAVLTAYPSAALMDIMRTVKMRFPVTRVVVFPIPVQGKDAYIKIADTLKFVDTLKFNTIIIARGGGSLEDLWNFNEELLARTIFHCQTPVISGVGHEIDFTICDFVSDYRGATPTAAAIKATPDLQEMMIQLNQQQSLLVSHMKHLLENNRNALKQIQSFYLFRSPEKLYTDYLQQLSFLQEKLQHNFTNSMQKKRSEFQNYQYILSSKNQLFINQLYNKIDHQTFLLDNSFKNKYRYYQDRISYLISKLNALSPLKTLERGYAIVYKDKIPVSSVKAFKENDEITVQMKDGSFSAIIKEQNNG